MALPVEDEDIQKTFHYEAGFDVVLQGVIDFFATNSIPIKTIEKDSGIIYSERSYAPSDDSSAHGSGFADCPSRPLVTFDDVIAEFNVFVPPNDQGKTKVQITTRFWRTGITPGILVVPHKIKDICKSNGKFEKVLSEHLTDYITKKKRD